MPEYCITNDEGVIEDGFYSQQEAQKAVDKYYLNSGVSVELRELYDEDDNWIEDDNDNDE